MPDDIITISAAEYKAIMGMSAKMAETNAVILEQNRVTQEAVKAMIEKQDKVLSAIKSLFDNLNITVNVPEQSAPVVNLPAAKSKKYYFIRDHGVIIGIEEAMDE